MSTIETIENVTKLDVTESIVNLSVVENPTLLTTTDFSTVVLNDVKSSVLTRLVPYSGATQDVNLGNNSLSLESTTFSLTPTITPTQGQVYWDATDKTLAVDLDVTHDVTLQVGQESHVRVANKTGVTITDGSVVYIEDAQGNRPTAALAIANDITKCRVIGIATQDIANNAEGYVTTSGTVHGFNTTGMTDGATLYLSPSVAGALTETLPASPNFVVTVATALNSTNNGSIFVHAHSPIAADTSMSANSDLVAPTQKAVKSYVDTGLATKQATLVSGTNIKTVNGNTLLGSGDVSITSAVAWGAVTGTLSNQTDLQTALNAKESASNKSTDTSLGTSDTLYPTQNAVKSYVDAQITAEDFWDRSGTTLSPNTAGDDVTTSGVLSTTNATASSSTSTGALIVSGGVGIAKQAVIGQGLLLSSVSSGLRVEGAVFPTGTGPGFEAGYSSGGSTSYFQSYNRTSLAFAPLAISGSTISMTQGNVSITNTTASTSISTGALIVSGGVGISGSLHLGSTATIANTVRIQGAAFTLRLRRDTSVIDFTDPTEASYAAGTIQGSSMRLYGNNGQGITVSSTGIVTLNTDLALTEGGTGASTAEAAYTNVADMTVEPTANQTANGPHTNDLAAGATISAFDVVYLGSSSKWLQTDADAESTSKGMLAMSLEAKTDTQAMNVALPGSIIRNDSWAWTAGAVLYLSTTAGGLTETAPSATDDVVRVVGYALTDDCIYFNPSQDYLVIV